MPHICQPNDHNSDNSVYHVNKEKTVIFLIYIVITFISVTIIFRAHPTVFRGKFCQISWASSQNFAAHCGKIVQIPWLTAAFHSCVN